MLKQLRLDRKRSLGFTLVEIMVAVLIGMFGVLIMMQVLSVSEEQKRTTTSGNDAMNEGVLALYALQTEIRSAGFGISDPLLLGCSLTLRAGVTLPALAPVIINPDASAQFPFPAADANTDTLLVFSTTNFGSPQGDKVIATVGTSGTMLTPSSYTTNDWVLVAQPVRPNPCGLTLERVAGVAGSAISLVSGNKLNKDNRVFNLGQSIRVVGYAVRSGNLTMCDYSDPAVNCGLAASWPAISSNIASLRVQYGRDITPSVAPAVPTPGNQAAGMDGLVDVYIQVPALTTFTMCEWARVSAVRMALVARSAQMSPLDPATHLPEIVTSQAPDWDGGAANNPPGSSQTPINLSSDANWQYYRYKTFQTVVPIRNIAWAGKVTGC